MIVKGIKKVGTSGIQRHEYGHKTDIPSIIMIINSGYHGLVLQIYITYIGTSIDNIDMS